jgi:hypothetical protein
MLGPPPHAEFGSFRLAPNARRWKAGAGGAGGAGRSRPNCHVNFFPQLSGACVYSYEVRLWLGVMDYDLGNR